MISSISSLKNKIVYDVLGRVPRKRPFVFGIGLSKTGTTSLNDALKLLGYQPFHLPPIAKADAQGNIYSDWPWWVWKHDAMTDLSVAVLHRELRAEFPNARFIYTTRDMDRWSRSCRKHFTQELRDRRVEQGQTYLAPLVKAFYGSELYDEDGFRAAYMRHEAEVLALHGGQENFMSYDLTAGEGWEPLCQFLDKAVPQTPFPKSNKARA